MNILAFGHRIWISLKQLDTSAYKMSQIFISHSTKDKSIAIAVLNHLRALGYPDDKLFLDDDDQSGILPGLRWENQLFTSLEKCACLIVINSKNWRSSNWCFAEALIAKNLDRKIIPLLVDTRAELNTIVSDYQSIRDFTLDNEKLGEMTTSLERLNLGPDGNSEGWTVTSATDATREKIAAIVRGNMPWWWNVTQLLTIAIFAIVLTFSVGTTVYVFRQPIYEFLFPAPKIEMSAADFAEAVRDSSKRETIVNKTLIGLTGKPTSDYSASNPKINVESDVDININTMNGGVDIPDNLDPNKTYEFNCFVPSSSSINELVIPGIPTKYTVYVTNVELIE